MSMFDYWHFFWAEVDKEPFSATEIALYSYLVHQANVQRWEMPVYCNTAIIAFRMTTSKQNIIKARAGLKERGLIDFEKGDKPRAPASYVLLNGNAHNQKAMASLTTPLTNKMTNGLTSKLTTLCTSYNIEEKDKDKDKEGESDISPRTSIEALVDVDCLKAELMADKEWQDMLLRLLAKNGVSFSSKEDLKNDIDKFFDMLNVTGCRTKTKKDCKSHCYNWIRKIRLNNNTNNNIYGRSKNKQADGRRAAEVQDAPSDAYEGAF